MKEIPLTKGYVALVSDADYERVSQFKWQAKVNHHTVYARGRVDGKDQFLHRIIMNVTDPMIYIDHRDHDGLNNQRKNLRVCSRSQNMSNQRKIRATSSQFKGVCWHRGGGKWQAKLKQPNGKQLYLGLFTDEIDAACAYDDAARQHFGAFALTNFPEVVVEPCQDYPRAA
jgi:hypothetical protein